MYASGRNVRVSRGPLGTHINIIDTGGAGGDDNFIASVDQSDAGGGYYTCDIQKLDAGAKWEDDGSDILTDNTKASDVTVFNLAEHEESTHNLAPSDLMFCWKVEDTASVSDAGSVYLGFPINNNVGKVWRAKPQEGPQADGTLSVKLYDSEGATPGDAFDIYAFPSKAATDYTNHLPIVNVNNPVLVMQDLEGDWIMVNPTLTNMGSKTDTVDPTAETTGGRFLSKWIEEF